MQYGDMFTTDSNRCDIWPLVYGIVLFSTTLTPRVTPSSFHLCKPFIHNFLYSYAATSLLQRK